MKMTKVNSTDIRAVGYESNTRTLQIEFLRGGTYVYANVSEKVYSNLLRAESKGVFFREHIRTKYDYKKVG